MHFTACDVIYSQFSENRLKLSLSSGFKDQEIHFFIEISHFVEVLNKKTRMTHIKKIIVLQKKVVQSFRRQRASSGRDLSLLTAWLLRKLETRGSDMQSILRIRSVFVLILEIFRVKCSLLDLKTLFEDSCGSSDRQPIGTHFTDMT